MSLLRRNLPLQSPWFLATFSEKGSRNIKPRPLHDDIENAVQCSFDQIAAKEAAIAPDTI